MIQLDVKLIDLLTTLHATPVFTLSEPLALASYSQPQCVSPAEPRRSRVCGSWWCWHADTDRAAPGLAQATEPAEEPTWGENKNAFREEFLW